jgi:hypothetical protein
MSYLNNLPLERYKRRMRLLTDMYNKALFDHQKVKGMDEGIDLSSTVYMGKKNQLRDHFFSFPTE